MLARQKLLLAIWRPLPPAYSCRLFWLHRESPTTSSLSSQEGLSAEKFLFPQQALPPCFSDTSVVATHYTPQGSQATLALLMKTYQAINSLYKAKLLLASSTYCGPALCWLSLVYWQSLPLPQNALNSVGVFTSTTKSFSLSCLSPNRVQLKLKQIDLSAAASLLLHLCSKVAVNT